MKKVKITEIKLNPNNPRIIKDEKFNKLKISISDFPEMMEKRPMICVTDKNDGKIYPLGGNMRLKAMIDLGFKEIPEKWINLVDDWSEEKRKEFLIKDNVSFGEWDFQVLNGWDKEELEDWGLDLEDKIIVDGKEIEINEEFEPAEELGIEKEYLMIVFENKEQHEEAIDLLGLKIQREVNNKKVELNNVGIQRVMKYENLRTIIK